MSNGTQVTLGGERLGSGKKNKVYMRDYERSSHDLGEVIKTTMSAGTLVPFYSVLALPGDTFDVNLDVDVMTHPTVGPLFGSYKVQIDMFQVPIRLYQGKLHMNMLNIGLDMSKVPFPQIEIKAYGLLNPQQPIDNQQINPSCIFSYLGIRGIGYNAALTSQVVARRFNAIPYLGYWEIYKNYYANKQEDLGCVIHKDLNNNVPEITSAAITNRDASSDGIPIYPTAPVNNIVKAYPETNLILEVTGMNNGTTAEQFILNSTEDYQAYLSDIFNDITIDVTNGYVYASDVKQDWKYKPYNWAQIRSYANSELEFDSEPTIHTFPLTRIDEMRQNLLSHFGDTPYIIDNNTIEPYNLPLLRNDGDDAPSIQDQKWSKQYSQEGLALKTYNSDLLNNWIQTEWIDGENGISEITKVDTSEGSFLIDELNLRSKVYTMLNRIAISGGSYDDWLDAVYTHDRQKQAESPIYLGGLITNLVFQEVISNSQSGEQPLGTLAGRGKIGGTRKGGKIVARIDEPSYIMGIVSLTPRIDYSQGNKWDMNLKNMNDLHKPALDEIGFQDLVTDQMAWWDTSVTTSGATAPTFKSAGKQPAWLNYMTSINRVLGNFAEQSQQMFMVLNRRYNFDYTGGAPSIGDVTTYIDPTKFNNIFADTARDAQNFWCQIKVENEARRKMSAKVIPNL